MLDRLLAVLALCWVGCSSSKAPPERRKLVDGTTFRAMLEDPETRKRIQDISIQPLGRHAARYVVRFHDRNVLSELDAEYPGTLVERIQRAGIVHAVAPEQAVDWPQTTRELHDITEAAFRAMVTCPRPPCDGALSIESVRIEPLESDQARYVIRWKSRDRSDAAIAAFPGDLVEKIVANNVMYDVHAPILE